MKMRDIIRRAGRSLRHAKARTILTSLAIAVGAFTITLALAAGEGGRQYAENLVNANADETELQVTQRQDAQNDPTKPREYSESPTLSYGGGYSVKLMTEDDIARIVEIEGVQEVTPSYDMDVLYVTREGQSRYEATVQAFNPRITQEYTAGNGEDLSSSEILLPQTYRESLGFASDEAAIGQPIEFAVQHGGTGEVRDFTFTIAGVTKPSSFALFATPSFAVVNDAAREIYTYNREDTPQFGNYTSALVQAQNGMDVEMLKARINDAGFEASTAEDAMGTLFEFINVLQGILIGFGALAVVTSLFGIINTQYISVLERTQQIGLMKALGMRRRDVGRLFKFEAAWIGFLGGAIGVALAIGIGMLLNPWISDTLSLGEETNLLVFSTLSAVLVIVGLTIVSVTAGILPARKAAKLDPIEALRTE